MDGGTATSPPACNQSRLDTQVRHTEWDAHSHNIAGGKHQDFFLSGMQFCKSSSSFGCLIGDLWYAAQLRKYSACQLRRRHYLFLILPSCRYICFNKVIFSIGYCLERHARFVVGLVTSTGDDPLCLGRPLAVAVFTRASETTCV